MKLARRAITRVSKMDFLQAFQSAFNKAFSSDNICPSFRGAGLVPLNPNVVLEKLEIRFSTPTPSPRDEAWQSQTPRNIHQLKAQYELIRGQLRDTSPQIQESIDKLAKGPQLMVHSATLIRDKLSSLQLTLQEQQQHKGRKRRYVQKDGHLTVSEARDIGHRESIEEERPRQMLRLEESLQRSTRAPPTCTRCGVQWHTI